MIPTEELYQKLERIFYNGAYATEKIRLEATKELSAALSPAPRELPDEEAEPIDNHVAIQQAITKINQLAADDLGRIFGMKADRELWKILTDCQRAKAVPPYLHGVTDATDDERRAASAARLPSVEELALTANEMIATTPEPNHADDAIGLLESLRFKGEGGFEPQFRGQLQTVIQSTLDAATKELREELACVSREREMYRRAWVEQRNF